MEDSYVVRQNSSSDNVSGATPLKCYHGKPIIHKPDAKTPTNEDPVTRISYVVVDETINPGYSDLSENSPFIAGVHMRTTKTSTSVTHCDETVLNKDYEPQTDQNLKEDTEACVGLLHATSEGYSGSCSRTSLVTENVKGESCIRTLLTPEDSGSSQSLQSIKSNSDSFGNYECAVCYELMLDPTSLPCSCNYSYCRRCIAEYYKKCGSIKCPMCRKQWKTVPPVNQALKMEIMERFGSVYRKGLAQQSASELETIRYLESKDHHHHEKKAGINFLPFPLQFGNDRGIRLCFIFMAVSLVIIIVGLWFAIP